MDPAMIRQLYTRQEVPTEEEPESSGSSPCRWASEFLAWIEKNLSPLLEHDPSIIEINQAYLFLLHNYMIRRRAAPKAHRYLTNTRGHLCLWAVFEATYCQIELIAANLPISKWQVPTPTPKPAPVIPQPRMPDLFAGLAQEDTDE